MQGDSGMDSRVPTELQLERAGGNTRTGSDVPEMRVE